MSLRITDAFERIVVLNLDRRPDRLAAAKAELDRVGIPFERFAAVDGRAEPVRSAWQAYVRQPPVEPPAGQRVVTNYREFYLDYDSQIARVAFVEQRSRSKAIATPGAFGLLLSMTRIVEQALEKGWRSILILEDDVLFHHATPGLFARAYRQLPDDWVILQLGAMQLHWDEGWIEPWSENLYRCHGSSIGAHAVGLRREALAPLLEACRRQDLPFDVGALHDIKRRYRERCFTILPNIAIQDASDSEIGMSTLFFREARKVDNLYRWHLPDYGPPGLASAIRAHSRMPTPSSPFSNLRRGIERTLLRLGRRRAPRADPPPSAERADGAPPKVVRRGLQPLRALAGSRPNARCVFAVVVGVPPGDLETLIRRLMSQTATVPVFLTDDDRFEIFRRHRAIFEYLPPIEPAPDLDVDLYRLRRLALLRRKWQPVRIVGFGAPAARIIEMWRASPFEDQRIEELTGGAPVRATGQNRPQ